METSSMYKPPLLPLLRSLVKKVTKLNIINQDNLPKEGSILLTTNHLSLTDTPLLLTTTERTDVVAIVAKKYLKKPLIKWALEKIGNIVWMDRENTDFSAVRQALDYLNQGAILGIAPEGTRSKETLGLLEGKPGAALLAARANVPIVPVGIVGSEFIKSSLLKLKRTPVTINIGQPYRLPEFDRENRQKWLTQCTDEIMCRIGALLPPAYRGFYSDHPRLKELLAEQSAA